MTVIRTSQFERLAKKNKRVVKLEKMMDSGLFSIDTHKLTNELFTLHGTRNIRNLSSSDVLGSAQKKLLDIALENVAKRSRCVEIKMKAYRVARSLEQHLADMFNYLYSRYSDQLREEFRAITDRKSAVTAILQPFYNLLHKLKTVESLADMVISDCDQTGYATTNMTKAIEIAFARERNI